MCAASCSCALKCPSRPCQHHHARQHRGKGNPSTILSQPTSLHARPRKERGSPKEPCPRPSPKQSGAPHKNKGCEVCRRYQTGFCTNDQCRFAHVCSWAASRSALPWAVTNTRETALILARHRIGQAHRSRTGPKPGRLHSCPCRQRLPRLRPCPAHTTMSLAQSQGSARPITPAHQNRRCIQPPKSCLWTCFRVGCTRWHQQP